MELTYLEVISFAGSLASLILAVLSIWLAIYFYKEAKNAEKESSNLLTKTEQQISLMQRVTNKMLDRFVTYSTSPKQADEITNQLILMLSSSLPQNGSVSESSSNNNLEVDRLTGYIATAYWSGLFNAAIQLQLPEDIAQIETEEYSGHKNLLHSSKNDYFVSRRVLEAADQSLIAQSSASDYYDYIKSGDIDDVIKDVIEFYADKSRQSV